MIKLLVILFISNCFTFPNNEFKTSSSMEFPRYLDYKYLVTNRVNYVGIKLQVSFSNRTGILLDLQEGYLILSQCFSHFSKKFTNKKKNSHNQFHRAVTILLVKVLLNVFGQADFLNVLS